MTIFEKLRNLLFGPSVNRCYNCGKKDVAIEVWKDEKEQCFFACIHCEDCGHERVTYSLKSEDEAVKRLVALWNEESSFNRLVARYFKRHHART